MNQHELSSQKPPGTAAPAPDTRPFIEGKRIDAKLEARLAKVCPATKGPGVDIPESGAEWVDAAVAAAGKAQGSWRDAPLDMRKKTLLNVAKSIHEHAGEIARLDTLEMGKPIAAALWDAGVAAAYFSFYAEAIDKVYGQTAPAVAGSLETQTRIPRGVVGAITPWNFPSINAALKAAPALAAGNCVVMKPSEIATASSLRIAELAVQAGLPAGAFNVIPGGVTTGAALVASNGVDLVTFTGSTSTGKAIMRQAATESLKPLLLECGGKSPAIVFADALDNADAADLAAALAGAALWNAGQVCVARSRIYVQRSAYNEIVDALLRHCKGISLGLPDNEETTFGPLACETQYGTVIDAIETAQQTPAELVLDGRLLDRPGAGFYVGPTIFANAEQRSLLVQNEIFGPVIAVLPFDDEDEALALANDSCFGLAASVFTADFRRAHRCGEKLAAGKVAIYAQPSDLMPCWQAHAAEPMKQSGFGAEGGLAALQSYTSLKSVQYVYE